MPQSISGSPPQSDFRFARRSVEPAPATIGNQVTMAIELPNIVIRASAGSGKTYQLANRFLQLLNADVAPESILAATFTRKAAGEILERILRTLARAAVDDAECAKLAQALAAPHLTRTRCQVLLQRLTRHLHRIQVGTLDSIFVRLASSYSLELGLPPGWEILEDADLQRLREEAIDSLLESESDDELVRLLRLLSKGATTRSVNQLVLDTVQNCHEVSLQTPPDAWQRVPRPRLPTDTELKQSLAKLRNLAAEADKTIQKAVQADLEFAEQEQWEEMLKKGILKNLLRGETKYSRKELDAPTLAIYRKLLAQLSSIALNRLAWQTAATRELLDKFDHELRKLQRRQGGCSFSDVARALAERGDAFQNRPSLAATFRLDMRWSHLLLDEFQDTSPLQWNVLRPFAEQIVGHRTSKGRSRTPRPTFFCVGDVKQSIYGWRGGDARIFDTLDQQLPELRRCELAESWRSAPPIIETVNRVFQNLPRHPRLERLTDAVQAWTQAFPQHSTAKKELRGFVQLQTVAEKKKEESAKDVTLKAAAQLVAKLAAKHPTRSIGVLTRSNEAVAQLIFELHKLNVAASEEGGHPLTDSAAVLALLALLQLADHPGDEVARCHVATSPLGPAFKFRDFYDDRAAARLAGELRSRLLYDGYGPCLAAWSRMFGTRCTARDRLRLAQLVKLADAYQPSATLRPHDFVEFVREQRVADPSGDRIRVMTVHQAKGLQFDIVVLPELDHPIPGQSPALVAGNVDPLKPPDIACLYCDETIQQLLPSDLRHVFEQDLRLRTHEALCVLYVALTRAIHAMYLLIAPHQHEPTKSYAGLLRASLTEDGQAPPQTVLFQTGDPDWDSTAKDAQRVRAEPHVAAQRIGTIRFAPPLPNPTRGWLRAAPSEHVAEQLGDLLQPHDAASLEHGTLIHKWFEQIEWLEAERPSAEQLLAAARTLRPLTLDVPGVVPEFLAMLDQPAIAAALRRDSSPHHRLAPRVLREHPFACRLDGVLLKGTIDRLVVWYDGERPAAAEIIDYKTDRTPNAAMLAERIAFHRPQLESYRRAVSQLFGLEPRAITAKLLFVTSGAVSEV